MTETSPHDGVVTLGDLLAEPSLHVASLTPIRDLDRPIRYVYPTELADPSRYLSGDELILSVGVPVADQSEATIRCYVTALTGKGVTALVVGLGDLFDEPPTALVQACLDMELPLLTLGATVPFRRIVDWAESRRAADRGIEHTRATTSEHCCAGSWRARSASAPSRTHSAGLGLTGAPVVVCAFTSDAHARVHKLVDPHGGTVALLEDRVVTLCAQTEEFSAELAASPLVCGVAIAQDAQSMAYAIPEALEALREAIRWRRTVHIDEIATLEGLLAAVPKVRLVPFVQSLLVPLVDHDRGNNSHLVASLEAFLAPDTDISAAASRLYVHVNTLRNRLAKIAELTGTNPLDEADRINFRIALWAALNMGMRDNTEGDKPLQHNGIRPAGRPPARATRDSRTP